MNERPVTEAIARKFLLGQLDDLEREQIESLFFIDPEVKRTVLLAEADLVEDYLEGALTQSDAAQFLLHYGYPYQRRKLGIVRSLKEHALLESLPAKPSGIQRLRNLVSALGRPNRPFLVPVTVTVGIILLVATVWLAVRLSDRSIQGSDATVLVRQELTRLNSRSSLAETPTEMFSTALAPVSLRSVQPSVVKLQPTYRVIELKLLWPPKEEYVRYQAVLRRVGGSADSFTVPDLQVEKNISGSSINLRLPAQYIAPGLYQISVSGIAPDGRAALTEEYTFTLAR
jgi:hypothetical protein